MSTQLINEDLSLQFANMQPFKIIRNVIRSPKKSKQQIMHSRRRIKTVQEGKSKKLQNFKSKTYSASVQNSPAVGAIKKNFDFEAVNLNQQNIQLERSCSQQDQSSSTSSYCQPQLQQNQSVPSQFYNQNQNNNNQDYYANNNQQSYYNNNNNNNNGFSYESQQVDLSSLLDEIGTATDYFMQDEHNYEAYPTDKMDDMLDLNIDNEQPKYCNGVPTPNGNTIINYFNYEGQEEYNQDNNNNCWDQKQQYNNCQNQQFENFNNQDQEYISNIFI